LQKFSDPEGGNSITGYLTPNRRAYVWPSKRKTPRETAALRSIPSRPCSALHRGVAELGRASIAARRQRRHLARRS
jgi:hypothetical protein